MMSITLVLIYALYPIFAQQTPSDNAEHLKILVITGSEFFAGTDAKVFIELGTNNDRKLKFNPPEGTKFPRDSQVVFSIDSAIPLSDICSITVSQDRTGRRSDWFLRGIAIKNSIQKVDYPFNSWLTNLEPNKTISSCDKDPLFSHKRVDDPLIPATDNFLAPPSVSPPGMMVGPPGVPVQIPPGGLVPPPGAPPAMPVPAGTPGLPPPCPESLPLPSCKV